MDELVIQHSWIEHSSLGSRYTVSSKVDQVASESNSKSVSLDASRRLALIHIEAFILSFSNPQAFSAAAASSATAALTQVTNFVRIQDAGHLRCSGAEIGRFISMLRYPSTILKACAAFALLQLTIPGGRHVQHHVSLLQKAGASRVLRAAAAATGGPLEAKIFAKIVLRNLEQNHSESSLKNC